MNLIHNLNSLNILCIIFISALETPLLSCRASLCNAPRVKGGLNYCNVVVKSNIMAHY